MKHVHKFHGSASEAFLFHDKHKTHGELESSDFPQTTTKFSVDHKTGQASVRSSVRKNPYVKHDFRPHHVTEHVSKMPQRLAQKSSVTRARTREETSKPTDWKPRWK